MPTDKKTTAEKLAATTERLAEAARANDRLAAALRSVIHAAMSGQNPHVLAQIARVAITGEEQRYGSVRFLYIAKDFGLPYWAVLCLADYMSANRDDAWTTQARDLIASEIEHRPGSWGARFLNHMGRALCNP